MKYCLTILLSVFLLSSFGQIEKGKWISSMSINGNNYRSERFNNNLSGGYYSKSTFGGKISLNRFFNKNHYLGFGLSFNSDNTSDFVYSNPIKQDKIKNTGFGLFVNWGKYHKVSENIYYSYNLTLGANRRFRRNYSNYGLPNQIKNTDTGDEIFSTVAPLGLSYCFKQKYLLTFSVLSINYYKTNYKTDIPNFTYNVSEFDYSFNPFNNGISINYIF